MVNWKLVESEKENKRPRSIYISKTSAAYLHLYKAKKNQHDFFVVV